MEVEETRPKRKSFGSFISPGPYQKPLAIAIPPLTSGIENFRQILLFDGYFQKTSQQSKYHTICLTRTNSTSSAPCIPS